MMRNLIAGVVAGVVVFVWGFVSHMLLPLGTAGVQSLPHEDAVVAAMKQNIAQPGFYFFPGMADPRAKDKAQQQAGEKAWQEKYRRGPSGILVITPGGREPMSAAQLGGELLTDILGALVAAILLGMAAVSGFGARVLFVTLLGLFASLAIDFSYWIWYAFPTAYTLAALADQVLGWFCGGLALAKMVKPQRR